VSEDQADASGLNEVAGIYVRGVADNGAAAESGMKEGDIILKVGDASVKNVPQLQEQIARYRPGDKVNLTVWRDKKMQTVNVTLKNRDGKAELKNFEESAAVAMADLGAEFTDISDADKDALRITGGAKVKSLSSGKLAAVGIQKGFIITKVDKTPIASAEDLKIALTGKTGNILLEGYYPNGTKAIFGFGLR
jgi:serine protease Do